MLKISTGKISRPQKVVIFGCEGIGKSTLASQFPDPLFIDTERSTTRLDVRRVEPENWKELMEDVAEVSQSPDICKTLVIDTADWAEQMAIRQVVANANSKNINGIEDFGYSKGYTYLAEEFEKLLRALDKVIDAGINVVVTAHAAMRKFEQPDEMGAYDRWEMKLSKRVCPLLKEWCDLLLFCNYDTYVVQSGNVMEKAKVQGGKRVMYTTHNACWDAKNRHGLPDKLPLEYSSISSIFQDEPEQKPIEKLRELMKSARVTDSDVRRVVSEKNQYPEETPIESYSDKFITGWLIKNWEKIVNIIREENKNG